MSFTQFVNRQHCHDMKNITTIRTTYFNHLLVRNCFTISSFQKYYRRIGYALCCRISCVLFLMIPLLHIAIMSHHCVCTALFRFAQRLNNDSHHLRIHVHHDMC